MRSEEQNLKWEETWEKLFKETMIRLLAAKTVLLSRLQMIPHWKKTPWKISHRTEWLWLSNIQGRDLKAAMSTVYSLLESLDTSKIFGYKGQIPTLTTSN